MAQFVQIAPLWAVSEVIHDRIGSDAATSGYKLVADAADGDMAVGFLAVAPAYQGIGANVQTGVDPETGVYVVLQIEAYAANTAGGAKRVSDMMEAVAVALSRSDLVVDVRTASGTQTSAPMAVIVESDVLNRNVRDDIDGIPYAQRITRYRFLVLL